MKKASKKLPKKSVSFQPVPTPIPAPESHKCPACRGNGYIGLKEIPPEMDTPAFRAALKLRKALNEKYHLNSIEGLAYTAKMFEEFMQERVLSRAIDALELGTVPSGFPLRFKTRGNLPSITGGKL